jgi:hypothetical protein
MASLQYLKVPKGIVMRFSQVIFITIAALTIFACESEQSSAPIPQQAKVVGVETALAETKIIKQSSSGICHDE